MFLPLFLLLILLRLDTIPFLHLSQAEGVRYKSLISRLLLLFDCEERVLPDLGLNVADRVGILNGDKVFMGSTDLSKDG